MADATVARRGLFRRESLQTRASAWQGQPSLRLGLPATFTTIAAVAVAAALSALLAFGSYARRLDLDGAVLPTAGLIAISAPFSGWIESLAAREGAAVEKGTPLYTVDIDTGTKGGDVQQLIANILVPEREIFSREIDRKTQLLQENEKNLKKKISNIQNQIDQSNTQIATSQGFYDTLNAEYTTSVDLLQKHQVARSEFDTRQQAWMRSQTQLQELESNRLRLEGALDDARHQLSTIAIDTSNEIDALKTKISDIDEKLAAGQAHGTIVIRAPGSGVVTDIVAHPGQVVRTGAPMLTIVPARAEMQVALLAPSSAIGFIRPGQRVLLRYSAFPYQKFGERPGRVVSVARAALGADEAKGMAGAPPKGEPADPLYRVIVRPDEQYVDVSGERRPLPVNMRVNAYVLLDRRPLYQWALQPLYAFGRAAHQG